MPAPTGVSIEGTMVIAELEDTVNEIRSRDTAVTFGTIVLRGSGATVYADGDIVLAKECNIFQSEGLNYAIFLEANILLLYTPV